jgi:alpha-L-fucosidase
MNVHEGDIKITSLGKKSALLNNEIAAVVMLGSKEKLNWTQTDDALIIKKPANMPNWQVTGYKIEFKK